MDRMIACLGGSGREEYEAVFIGIRPSKSTGQTDYGHVWLVLASGASFCGANNCEIARSNRPMSQPVEDWVGYYPEAPVVPPEIADAPPTAAVREFLRYFLVNHVPGVKRIDRRAYLLATRFPERISWIGVFGQKSDLAMTIERTKIRTGEAERVGRYGLDTSVVDVNNCVSWAVNIAVNPSLEPSNRFTVDNPPKVRSFIERIENRRCRLAVT
jgi:hypothetical protein